MNFFILQNKIRIDLKGERDKEIRREKYVIVSTLAIE